MELVHDFTVPVPADQAWVLLTDVQRVAPCLPGAAVTSVDGDAFEGGMKIKLGPISMTFKGAGELVEKDQAARRAVIEARGRDAKGNGGAQATVTATLAENGGSTDVHVVTDLHVTGKAAQFGGGVIKDVSNRMLAQFADNLRQLIASDGAGAVSGAAADSGAGPSSTAGAAASGTIPATRATVSPSDEGVDALGLLLGSEAARDLGRPLLAGLVGLLIGYLYGKNRVLEGMVRHG